MAHHATQTVVIPSLPAAALSAADRLLLDLLFASKLPESDPHLYHLNGSLRFEADREAAIVSAAIDASPPGFARRLLESAVRDAGPTVPIDLAGSWEELLQDIVRRSPQLDHIVVITVFTCDPPQAGRVGGAATVITAAHIDSLSTFDFVETILAARLSAKP
jgi:hypothetical protein